MVHAVFNESSQLSTHCVTFSDLSLQQQQLPLPPFVACQQTPAFWPHLQMTTTVQVMSAQVGLCWLQWLKLTGLRVAYWPHQQVMSVCWLTSTVVLAAAVRWILLSRRWTGVVSPAAGQPACCSPARLSAEWCSSRPQSAGLGEEV